MATFYSLFLFWILNCLPHVFATSSNINRHLLNNDDRSLFEYGIITGSDKISDGYVFLSLYFNEYGYFCRITPYKTKTPFICRQNEWVVEERCFDDNMGEYELVIENYNKDGMNIESVIINGIPIELVKDVNKQKQYTIPFSYKNNAVVIDPDDITKSDTDDPNNFKFSIKTDDDSDDGSEGQLTMRYYSKDKYKYICRYFPEKKNTVYTCDNNIDNSWVRYSCNIKNPKKMSLINPYTDMVDLTEINVDVDEDYTIKNFCAKKGSINGGDSGDSTSKCPDSMPNKYETLRIEQGDYKPIYWLGLTASGMSKGYAKVINGTYLYQVQITACDGFKGDMDELIFMLKGDLGNTIKFVIGDKFKVFSEKDDITTYLVGGTYIGRFVEAIFEPKGSNDICMKSMTFENKISGEYYEFGYNYFGAGVWIKNGDNSFEKHPESKTFPHTFLKVYPKQFRVTLMSDTSNMKLLIHTCDNSNDQSKSEMTKIKVSITGTMADGSFISTELISLKSDGLDDGRLREFQWNYVSLMSDISLVQIRNENDKDNLLCIDKVKINDQEAFITNTDIGTCSDDQCSIAVYAVLAWPVCKIEAINVKYKNTKEDVDHVAFAEAECNNFNRFMSTNCEISQTFSIAQEASWELQTGKVQSEHFEHEVGISLAIAVTKETKFWGIGKASVEVTLTASTAFRHGDRTDTYNLYTQTNGTSRNEEVHCGSTVSVSPQETVTYDLFIEKNTVETVTLTDLKLWKCSFLFDANSGDDDDDKDDESHYMIIQDVPGKMFVASATSCDVTFQQSTPLFKGDKFSCQKAVQLVGQSYATYIPVCNANNPKLWNKCQCSWGDKWTEADCICVNKNNGNPTGVGAVMKMNAENKDLDTWCKANCGTDSQGKVFVFDNNNNNKIKANIDHYVTPLWVLVFIAAIFVCIYGISTFRKSRSNQYGYSKIEMYSKSDIDTENEV